MSFQIERLCRKISPSQIEDEDVDGPMTQVIHMHVIAGFCADDAIVSINNAKHLLATLRLRLVPPAGKVAPTERESSSARTVSFTPKAAQSFGQDSLCSGSRVAQLLPAFRKSATNQVPQKSTSSHGAISAIALRSKITTAEET